MQSRVSARVMSLQSGEFQLMAISELVRPHERETGMAYIDGRLFCRKPRSGGLT